MNFEEHLLTFLDKDTVNNILNAINKDRVYSFKLNTRKIDKIEDITDNKYKKDEYLDNCYYYDENKEELGKSLLFNAGAFYIQDSSAMLPASFLDIHDNDMILDMCAAPGGKTFDVALKSNKTNILIANELSFARAGVLSSNMEKYGLSNVIVLNEDPSRFYNYFVDVFDKIILDAPCSGSAMFRKNEKAMLDWNIGKVLKCKEIQIELIKEAYMMLKEGGELIYSTCSFSKEENEEVIKELLDSYEGVKIININKDNRFEDTIGIKGGIRVYPHKFNGEGQVMFKIKKNLKTTPRILKTFKSNNIPNIVFEALDNLHISYDKNEICKIKDKFYLLPGNKIDLSKFHLMKYGVALGYIDNGRFVYDHEIVVSDRIDKTSLISLNELEASDYYKGLTLNKDVADGFHVVGYKGLPLGLVKAVKGTLKNHLPKGLRH